MEIPDLFFTMSTDYESVLCVKPEVHVYKIPPRASNRGYRAADWKLEQPDWTGRLKVIAKGNDCFVKLEANDGELFAKAPIDTYPGIAVEAVNDSSRYFVIRIVNENGRHAFIGIGFTDRGDSFDFNVALQDHFKWVKNNQKLEEEAKSGKVDTGPKLDLGFKAGQTITLNIAGNKGSHRPRSSGSGGGIPGLLPPPPGGKVGVIPPPSASSEMHTEAAPVPHQQSDDGFGGFTSAAPSQPAPQQQQQQTSSLDLLGGFGGAPSQPVTTQQQQPQGVDLLGGFAPAPSVAAQPQMMTRQPPQTQQTAPSTDWGDFTSAQSGSSSSSNSSNNSGGDGGNWVQF